jgi:hypothetical protein
MATIEDNYSIEIHIKRTNTMHVACSFEGVPKKHKAKVAMLMALLPLSNELVECGYIRGSAEIPGVGHITDFGGDGPLIYLE